METVCSQGESLPYKTKAVVLACRVSYAVDPVADLEI